MSRHKLLGWLKRQTRRKAVLEGKIKDHGAGSKADMKRKSKALSRRRRKLAKLQRQRGKK